MADWRPFWIVKNERWCQTAPTDLLGCECWWPNYDFKWKKTSSASCRSFRIFDISIFNEIIGHFVQIFFEKIKNFTMFVLYLSCCSSDHLEILQTGRIWPSQANFINMKDHKFKMADWRPFWIAKNEGWHQTGPINLLGCEC